MPLVLLMLNTTSLCNFSKIQGVFFKKKSRNTPVTLLTKPAVGIVFGTLRQKINSMKALQFLVVACLTLILVVFTLLTILFIRF